MNGNAARFFRLGVSLSGLMILGWVLSGQAAKPPKRGIPLPNDWTHSRVIFSRPGTAEQFARVSQDPRYQMQIHRREQALMLPAGVDAAPFANSPAIPHLKKGDWAEDLGTGASAGAGNYPAKYSLRSNVANCGTATAPDYVVYSTGLQGAPGPAGQASVVAYDNIYSGCGGTVPSMYWAYNTGGQVLTSPVLSQDGSQVAFVETKGGFGILTIVRWAAAPGDTISNPETLTITPPNTYLGCHPTPCMTQIDLKDKLGSQTDDTTSWAFYDYGSDVAWIGGALGWLHKVTGVFKGTPKEVTTGGFPVQLNAGTTWLSSPVFDGVSTLFVGDASGFLYRVNSSTGAFLKSGQLDFGTGLEGSPVVDVTNGFVYVFASRDNSTACAGGPCAAVYQLSTTFAAGTTGRKVIIGKSRASVPPNPNPTFVGAFDSTYYNSVGGTGKLYVCGNTGASPTLYQIPVAAGIPGASTAVTALTTASTAACSGVTDLPNPNTAGGPSERLFVSVQNKGIATACSAGGCIFNFVDTPWKASTAYAIGQQVLSSRLSIQTVITAGTSGATAPTWTLSAGTKTTDGSVVWIHGGNLSASTNAWAASHNYSVTTTHIVDSNGYIEVSTHTGTSGSSAPSWSTTPGGTTPDGTVIWTNAGKSATAATPEAGGTSGVIADNTVGSLAGASRIYFTTLSSQVCGTSGTGGCAVQTSQSALQ